MERILLKVTDREVGKGRSRRLRRDQLVPAILYGKGEPARPLSVPRRELERALKTQAGRNILIDVAVDKGETVVGRIKDLQVDPISQLIVHADFQKVDLSSEIEVEVPIRYVGKAIGLQDGGIVEVSRRSIEVKCLPTEIPEFIPVDITSLGIGESLHTGDIEWPEGVKPRYHDQISLVQIVAPQKEDVAAPVVSADAVPSATGEPAAVPQGSDKATQAS